MQFRTQLGGYALRPNLLCIGGEDHSLRIPFLLALRDKGFTVSAAGTGSPEPFARAGIDYHAFELTRFFDPFADWATFKSIRKLIANLRPSVVQCFDTKLNLLVPLAAKGDPDVRVVSTINGLGWLYSSNSPSALCLRPVFRGLQKLANRATATTIFQNQDDQTFYRRHRLVNRGSEMLIPSSGIDIKKFERDIANGKSPAEIRMTLGLGACEVVLTVTRLTRQKGVPTLLKAAALVHKKRPGVRFLLVGPRENEGPLAVALSEIERHASYVTYLGPRGDVPSLLAAADVFAFPTELREGVPRVLLEASAAGCPIVTTSTPGCTDVVKEGWNGFTVEPFSPQLLAEKILTLLDDRNTAALMGRRAASFVREKFSLELTVARYSAVYEKLLANDAVTSGPVIDARTIQDRINTRRPSHYDVPQISE